MTYPTWIHQSPTRIVSEEQIDGTPDFIIQKTDDDRWHLKWRTSAMWSGPFATAREAKAACERTTGGTPDASGQAR